MKGDGLKDGSRPSQSLTRRRANKGSFHSSTAAALIEESPPAPSTILSRLFPLNNITQLEKSFDNLLDQD